MFNRSKQYLAGITSWLWWTRAPTLTLLMVGAVTLASAAYPARPGPRLIVEQDIVILGRVPEGRKLPVNFTLRNAGNQPLIIYGVSTSCGCTQARFPDKPVLPGTKTTVSTVFDTTNHPGNAHVVLLLKSNDPARPVYKLHIRAEVVQRWKVLPSRLVLAGLKPDRTYRRKITIYNLGSHPLAIQSVDCPVPWVKVKSVPPAVPPGSHEDIYFVVHTQSCNKGRGPGQTSLRVQVDDPYKAGAEIPLLIMCGP